MTALPQQLSVVPDLAELAAVSRELESKPATSAIEWAWDRFGPDVVLAASFQDCVLISLAAQVAPGIEVAFLDTGYHFAETLWYVEQVRARFDLNLSVIKPEVPLDDLWLTDPDACCAARKVEPLARALSGKAAWMSGLRRDEAPSRANSPIVSYDVGRGLVKVNPLATWDDKQTWAYVCDNDIPYNPLLDHGYASIGCYNCTVPGVQGRAGRWAGFDKDECGLHT